MTSGRAEELPDLSVSRRRWRREEVPPRSASPSYPFTAILSSPMAEF